MSFLGKIRRLFEPPPSPPGTVEFPYGCPACAEGIFSKVNRSSAGWQADKVKTKTVRGIPPFSYSCQTCGKTWKISDPGFDKANNYHWRVTYRDSTGTSYYVENCPHCNAQLSSYTRQGVGEEGRDHIWCMACGDERYSELFTNSQMNMSGPPIYGYSAQSSTTERLFSGPSKEDIEKRADTEQIFDKLVTELISIGNEVGYTGSESAEDDSPFDEHGRNIRVYEIGKTLKEFNRTYHAIVRIQKELGSDQAKKLKSVWLDL